MIVDGTIKVIILPQKEPHSTQAAKHSDSHSTEV